MLNLHHLRIFRTLAEEGSFTRAAEALFISQPAVSREVRALEQEIGVALVDRVGRGMVLTEAGRVLAERSAQLFGLEHDIEETMDELRGARRGRLSVAASQTPGTYLLPPVLAAFHAQCPEIELRMSVVNTEQVTASVLQFEFEIGLVEGPLIDDPRLEAEQLSADELVVVLPPGHRWTERASVTSRQLATEQFVLRERGAGTRSVVETRLAAAGVPLQIALEVTGTEAVKRAVQAGLGVSILSSYTVRDEVASGRLVTRPIRNVDMAWALSTITVAGRRLSPAATIFREVLRAEFGLSATSASRGRGRHP